MNSLASQSEAITGAQGAGVRLRVVGCGNPWAADDSVGLEVVRRLRIAGECECELLEKPQAGVELMQFLEGAETVLLIDAVSGGAPVGTVYLVPLPSPAIESRALGAVSSHGWGLAEVLQLMEALTRPTPRLLLVGIEIGTAVPGASRSPAVEEAIRIIVERFPALCAMLVAEDGMARRSPRQFAPGDNSFPGGRDGASVAEGGS